MAALPGSGSDGGFFLLKGSFFSPQSSRARSGRGLDQREVSVNLLVASARLLYLIGSV